MPMPTPCSVLDSPQAIARSFVDDYYRTLNSSPDEVSRFYEDSSIVSRPDPNDIWVSVTRIHAIKEKILESVDVENQHWAVESVESQPSHANGILVVVEGCVVGPAMWSFFRTGPARRRRFTQSFFLAPLNITEYEYFIHNDILLFSDSLVGTEAVVVFGTPHEIGRSLVDLYCWLLNTSPEEVAVIFYRDSSIVTRQEPNGNFVSITTEQAIEERIESMIIGKPRWRIETVESQRSYKDGIFVVIRGSVTEREPTMIIKRFHQTFFFVKDPSTSKYFSLNDVLILSEKEPAGWLMIQQLLTSIAPSAKEDANSRAQSEKEDTKPQEAAQGIGGSSWIRVSDHNGELRRRREG